MESTVYSRHFEFLFKTLTSSGGWVDYGQSISKFFVIYYFLVNIIFIVGGNLSMSIFWLKNSTSVKSFAAIGYLVPITNMVALKSYYRFKNRQLFKKLIADLNQDIFKPQNSEELQIVQKTLKKWWNVKAVLTVATCCSPVFSILTPFFSHKGLPFQAWFPIDINIFLRHEMAFIYQSICIIFNSGITIFTDTTVAGLCLFIGLLCDLLCYRLEQIGSRSMPEENKEQFVNCVYLHHSILEFLNTTDQVFGNIYFGQIFASTISMCMDLFLLSLTEPSFEFFFLVAYLVSVGNLLLVPCWFATEMTRKSENIPNAAYSCNWAHATDSLKKDIAIFMTRSQRPMKMYAANYFEISVETFVKIVRSTLSYYAVLQNLNMAERDQNAIE